MSSNFEKTVEDLRKVYNQRRFSGRVYGDADSKFQMLEQFVEMPRIYNWWFQEGEGSSAVTRYVRVFDRPGKLSGNIIRLVSELPSIICDVEIDGDVIRPLQSAPPIRRQVISRGEEHDVSVELEKLPIIDADPETHFLKRSTKEHEIPNLLKCQGNSCPGNPISPYIVQLLGRTKDGMLVFPMHLSFATVTGEPYPISQYKTWFLQLAHGLQSLHSCGIVHRDLRLQNLVFSAHDQSVIIIDLESHYGNCAAPELQYKGVECFESTTATDVWDMGGCMRQIIYANQPINQGVEWNVPPPFDKVVDACQQHRSKRATIEEVIAMLEAIGC